MKLIKESKELDAQRIENMIEHLQKMIKIAMSLSVNYDETENIIDNLNKTLQNLLALKNKF